MKVSVIIPTYNREKTLKVAIRSVLSQTFPVHEILVCDDGSTDNSERLVKGLKNIKIRWISGEHTGLPAVVRNRGIKEAIGDWIAFLDSDDVWDKDKIKKQIKLTGNYSVISTNAKRVYQNKFKGIAIKSKQKYFTFEDLRDCNNVINSSVLIKKELLQKFGFLNENEKFKAVEDYLLWLEVSTTTKIGFINEPLVKYNDDPDNSIRKYERSEKVLRRIVFLELLHWSFSTTDRSKYVCPAFVELVKSIF